MIRRRSFGGRALLVASTAVVTGCSGRAASGLEPPGPGAPTFGNFVSPPMVELCVTVTPSEAMARVLVDGRLLEADGCNLVQEGVSTVMVGAEGYLQHEDQVTVSENTTHTIRMQVTP